jgi:hypothetical protein
MDKLPLPTTTTETQQQAQIALSTAEELTKTKIADLVLRQYQSDVIVEHGRPTLSKEISREHRGILLDRRQSLANQLRGLGMSVAARDRAGVAITTMFRDGWPLYKMDNPKQVVAAYIHALQEFPVWAVESVCGALAKGLVEDARVEFPPSAAQVAKLCETKIAEMKGERAKFDRILSIVEIRRAPMTGEEREAARLRHEQWKANQPPDPEDLQRQEREKERAERSRVRNEQRILAEYKARGMQPMRIAGCIVSPTLLKNLGVLHDRPQKAEMDE